MSNPVSSNPKIHENPATTTTSNPVAYGSNNHKKRESAFAKFLHNVKEGVRAIEGKPEEKKEDKAKPNSDTKITPTAEKDVQVDVDEDANQDSFEDDNNSDVEDEPDTKKRKSSARSQYDEENYETDDRDRVVFVDSISEKDKKPAEPNDLDVRVIIPKKQNYKRDYRLDSIIINN